MRKNKKYKSYSCEEKMEIFLIQYISQMCPLYHIVNCKNKKQGITYFTQF